jgi:hypothetical protein
MTSTHAENWKSIGLKLARIGPDRKIADQKENRIDRDHPKTTIEAGVLNDRIDEP